MDCNDLIVEILWVRFVKCGPGVRGETLRLSDYISYHLDRKLDLSFPVAIDLHILRLFAHPKNTNNLIEMHARIALFLGSKHSKIEARVSAVGHPRFCTKALGVDEIFSY